ncbi:TPA: hypothetical protein N0F65_005846 [Lagenidium giganteum]|uniref:Uncharacterized protein n=1 Tax=Lagenidium giganteum TaxID=4803 RepID=A0AAV2YRY5_9STRA|nr:TPA: hypothetical protein N0F65_005846 [Lagenidium giganteum]
MLNELYKNVVSITKYQMFKMKHATPGVVECREEPDSKPVTSDLRRSSNGIQVSVERALQLLDQIEQL